VLKVLRVPVVLTVLVLKVLRVPVVLTVLVLKVPVGADGAGAAWRSVWDCLI
jgi:hypothetical protein